MTKQAKTIHGQTSEEAVRIEAYILSEKAGHPQGMEDYFWKQEETLVHSRLASMINEPQPVAKKKPAASSKPKAAVAAPKKAVAAPLPVPVKKPGVPAAPKTKTKAAPKTKAEAKIFEELPLPMDVLVVAPAPVAVAPLAKAPIKKPVKPAAKSEPIKTPIKPAALRKKQKR